MPSEMCLDGWCRSHLIARWVLCLCHVAAGAPKWVTPDYVYYIEQKKSVEMWDSFKGLTFQFGRGGLEKSALLEAWKDPS